MCRLSSKVADFAFCRRGSGICEHSFSSSMQDFFSHSDVFFDASPEHFLQQNGKFFNSPFENFQLQCENRWLPLVGGFWSELLK
jgi:hypothetical protein